uniref:Elongator complex protein 2 n=1 Tax=Panagrellus redivivus TaxID=6233 RepID=A0A7E4VMN9_PANRE
MKLDVKTRNVFTAISPIRNGLVWNSDRTIAAFATLQDICLCHASAFTDYTVPPIAKTIPLLDGTAALNFAQSSDPLQKDLLLLINAHGHLMTYEVTKNHRNEIEAVLTSTGEPSSIPSDFCAAQVYGSTFDPTTVSFWCRRDVLFWRSNKNAEVHHYQLKSDIKCFAAVVVDGFLFCTVGCVNGNVYYIEISTSKLSKLRLVSLSSPLAVPVLCVAVSKFDDYIVCAFSHGPKVTVVRWELASKKLDIDGSLKIRRDLELAGQTRFLSTDAVINEFSTDICALSFDETGKKLLVVSNENDFEIYEFRPDPEDEEAENWSKLVRGGEAGERPLGYCGGAFIPKSNRVLIYTTKGSFIGFDIVKEDDFTCAVEVPPPITGHQSLIVSAEWDPSGNILFTAGFRDHEIHAMATLKSGVFAQISRPESHQYDVHRIYPLSGLTLAVGSDELPFRIYKASGSFIQTLKQLTDIDINELKRPGEELPTTAFFKQPVLGVQNVAANGDEGENLSTEDFKLTERPTTNQLMKYTYWEVAESLYGHSHPSSSVTVSPDGKFLATCCLATNPKDSAVFVRKTSDWDIVSKLEGHTLSVNNLAFSPNSQYLVSVSRDRSYALYYKETDRGVWAEAIRAPEAHKRMILAAIWLPDSSVFITGGRDGVLAYWTAPDGNLLGTETLEGPITAADLARTPLSDGSFLIAAGFGTGSIALASINFTAPGTPVFTRLGTISGTDGFSKQITTIKFRPEVKDPGNTRVLAVASESSVVKVYTVTTPV